MLDSYTSRAERDDFFLDSLCLMWALCCLSDVMNITMAAEAFEICASHSICSPKTAWYNCSFQRGSQPWSFCGGLRTRLYKLRRYSWSRFVVSVLCAVFFLWNTKREIIIINLIDMTSMLYCWVSDVTRLDFPWIMNSVTHTKLLYSAMNTCNTAHNVKFMVLFLDSHEHNGY